jgi:hypothetical protein
LTATHPREVLAINFIAAGLVIAIALNAAYTTWAISSSQAAQRRQGISVEHKICATLQRLTALKPPAGDPGKNPSRAYEDDLHATLDQLGPDLGCAP